MYKMVTTYTREFEYRDLPGAGYSFECDKDGNLSQMPDTARDSFRRCVSGEFDVIDRGVVKYERRVLVCNCGSGLYPQDLYDARGILVTRACSECESRVMARYRPEIFTDSNYECDEQIEELD